MFIAGVSQIDGLSHALIGSINYRFTVLGVSQYPETATNQNVSRDPGKFRVVSKVQKQHEITLKCDHLSIL